MVFRSFILTLLTLISSLALAAQELPRRPFLGVRLERLTPEMRELMGITAKSGVLVSEVIPRSTASSAGFRKGDILISLNGMAFDSPEDIVRYVGSQRSGSQFSFEILRDKKPVNGESHFLPFPKESYADLDVHYSDARSEAGQHRIILTKKKNQTGRQPLIVFIGGIGCYSLDAPMDSNRSEIQLLNALARDGFITARLEKPGIGDGAGHSKPCNEISFREETDAYAAAIRKLRERSDVAADEVYIFGHSMGGVFAPLIAKETPVKGIIAYGTIGSNFPEHLTKTRRTIGEAYGWPPEETDAFVRELCECSVYYFAEKLTTEEAGRKNPNCVQYLQVFDLRSRSYNDELYALNIPSLWKDFKGSALLLWGESDYIASRDDHEILARAIRTHYKGKVDFEAVKNADHGMQLAGSFAEARTRPGPYNTAVGKTVLSWLRKQS